MGDIMIKKFKVKNFKNFQEELVLDFSKTRDYAFNQHLVKNNLINKMLIYGPNNSGKSNLGVAIMDITRHLVDNQSRNYLYNFFMNGNSIDKYVEFSFEFIFHEKNLKYNYKKNKEAVLQQEDIYFEDVLLFSYNYETNQYINKIVGAETIDFSKRNRDISAIKYMYNNNMYWDDESPIKLLIDFANNMLWFRSLKANEFVGVMSNGESLSDFIVNNHKVNDFQKFLKDCGQEYYLTIEERFGRKLLSVKYNNFIAPFEEVASTGTLSLWLFYYWMNRIDNISFVYLDEFDAFYHTKLSKYILKYINERSAFQSVLTTHNTYLADNNLMRPDCYTILANGKIKSFADRTTKVIRQAHNLERMMLGGEFEE